MAKLGQLISTIGFSNFASTNPFFSNPASSGITDGTTFVGCLTLVANIKQPNCNKRFLCSSYNKTRPMTDKKQKLEDYKVNIRIQLSAIWTAVMFCYIYGDYFELYVPKKVEGLVNGQNMLDSPAKLFLATFTLTIPALMIFLSLLLTPRLTKWLNIGVGIFFTLFTALVGVSSISEWRAFYVFLALLESLLTAAIVWRSWQWPKQNAA